MAALSEEGSYGLSCGQRNGDRVSVLHVKLTETAIRAVESHLGSKNVLSVQPTIHFQGLQGKIKIPRTDAGGGAQNFDFYLSSVGKDSPQGSFECVHQYPTSSGRPHLVSLGTVQDKITVCATNDSYQVTRERMTQAEEDTRKRGTKVIKPGGQHRGKTVQVRKPAPSAPDPVPERKRSAPINPANTIRKSGACSAVAQRSYRDRVIHLLALRTYKKLEVMARLQRDGVNPKDRHSLGSTLQQVATLNPRDNSYSLKEHIYREVQKDWPGYSEDERAQLDLILARKLGLPSENVIADSPPKEPAPSSSPQVRKLDGDFIDPLMSKKPRISHLTSRPPAPSSSSISSSSDRRADPEEDKRPAPPISATCATGPSPSHPPSASNSNSPSTPEGRGSQDLPLDQSSTCVEAVGRCTTPRTLPMTPSPPARTAHQEAQKKSKKHKEKEREKDGRRERDKAKASEDVVERPRKRHRTEDKRTPARISPSSERGVCVCSRSFSSPSLSKYTAVISVDQRQCYKDDFNAEYEEYRALHAKVESVTRRFMQLDTQCRRLPPGTKEYQQVREEVLQEYQKMKQLYPNYRADKQRCEYLHNKLSHIKRLIAEFDQRRAQSWA
uniref:OCEL domain-containing protein n=1 Tax=Denticeps clupeoides TaxID=299321 RepID=A0AAY4ADV1_9TELE